MMLTSHNSTMPYHVKGASLATTLILLLVMSLVGVSTMESSNFGFKVSLNTVYKEQAFANSENGHRAINDALVEAVWERSWSDVKYPDGMSAQDSTADPTAGNANTEDPYDTSTLVQDLNYTSGNIDADLYVIKGRYQDSKGTANCLSCGYKGAGKGGSGAGMVFYEVISEGIGPQNARVVTAVDYKVIVQ